MTMSKTQKAEQTQEPTTKTQKQNRKKREVNIIKTHKEHCNKQAASTHWRHVWNGYKLKIRERGNNNRESRH